LVTIVVTLILFGITMIYITLQADESLEWPHVLYQINIYLPPLKNLPKNLLWI
jgi:hypothetical protein